MNHNETEFRNRLITDYYIGASYVTLEFKLKRNIKIKIPVDAFVISAMITDMERCMNLPDKKTLCLKYNLKKMYKIYDKIYN